MMILRIPADVVAAVSQPFSRCCCIAAIGAKQSIGPAGVARPGYSLDRIAVPVSGPAARHGRAVPAGKVYRFGESRSGAVNCATAAACQPRHHSDLALTMTGAGIYFSISMRVAQSALSSASTVTDRSKLNGDPAG